MRLCAAADHTASCQLYDSEQDLREAVAEDGFVLLCLVEVAGAPTLGVRVDQVVEPSVSTTTTKTTTKATITESPAALLVVHGTACVNGFALTVRARLTAAHLMGRVRISAREDGGGGDSFGGGSRNGLGPALRSSDGDAKDQTRDGSSGTRLFTTEGDSSLLLLGSPPVALGTGMLMSPRTARKKEAELSSLF